MSTTPPPPPAPTTTTTTSSSSSSSSSGSSRAKPNYDNYIAMYLAALPQGFDVTKNIHALAQKAAHAKPGPWNVQRFIQALQQTPEFHQFAPGFFRGDGTPKFQSINQYVSQKQAYQDIATQAGVDLSHKDIANLFKGNVSVAEFRARAQADAVLEQNKPYFDQFKETLKAYGYKNVTYKHLQDFVMGKGNQDWSKIWANASARYTASQAGINFGKGPQQNPDLNLSNQTLRGLTAKQQAGALGASTFARLAQDLQTLLPQSRIRGYGLTKDDLVQLEFGGPRQASVAQKVQDIMASQKLQKSNTFGGSTDVESIGQRKRDYSA